MKKRMCDCAVQTRPHIDLLVGDAVADDCAGGGDSSLLAIAVVDCVCGRFYLLWQ
eukprot:m.137977 g.137977  ORF g.137977 m.137977 type:complete len:55 (+) comp13151_c1_seq2:110-274(+)